MKLMVIALDFGCQPWFSVWILLISYMDSIDVVGHRSNNCSDTCFDVQIKGSPTCSDVQIKGTCYYSRHNELLVALLS